MKASYINVVAQRGTGNIKINRIVKVMDGVNLFVDLNRRYIGITKGVYGSPASFRPSTKKAFDLAYQSVKNEIDQLNEVK